MPPLGPERQPDVRRLDVEVLADAKERLADVDLERRRFAPDGVMSTATNAVVATARPSRILQ